MPTIHRPSNWLGTVFGARQPPLDDYKLLPTTNHSPGNRSSVDRDGDENGGEALSIEQERCCHHRDERSPQRKPRRQSFPIICGLFGVKRKNLRRRFLYCLFFTPFVLALGVLISGIPPTYEDIRSYERQLPQHNITRATEEGHKYLKFRGQLWGHGLNNILQETILMSYLSYLANRSFVFDDYVWSHSPFPYTVYDFALRPSRTPFNAFISGPTAGGPISSESHTRLRAVNAEFYSSICPPSKVYLLPSDNAPHNTDGASFVRWWVDRLSSVPEVTCVEIDADKKQVFDLWLFGEKRILTLWDNLSRSPMLQNFSWSHLVLSAVLRNWVILRPPSRQTFLESLVIPSSHPPIAVTPDPLSRGNATYAQPGFPGLVAVHIRRGDFSRHCLRRATYNSSYMGFNQFPSFSDVFDPENFATISSDASLSLGNRIDDDDSTIIDRESYYMAHCFPSIPQVVARLHQVRKDHPGLKRVYVLSNARESWLNELSKELTKLPDLAPGSHPKESELPRGRWEDVVTGNDLILDSEQRYVDVAVDMAIAEQAEVFVGNGFSSASSNIVMLRMARGMDPKTIRFL